LVEQTEQAEAYIAAGRQINQVSLIDVQGPGTLNGGAGSIPSLVEQTEQAEAYIAAGRQALRFRQQGFKADPDILVADLLGADKRAGIPTQVSDVADDFVGIVSHCATLCVEKWSDAIFLVRGGNPPAVRRVPSRSQKSTLTFGSEGEPIVQPNWRFSQLFSRVARMGLDLCRSGHLAGQQQQLGRRTS
jgi:hypothetical protein